MDFQAKEMDAAWKGKSVYDYRCRRVPFTRKRGLNEFVHKLYLFTRWTLDFN